MEITEQQLFDTIVNHLRMQGCKSLNAEGQTVYRGLNGCRDPIGAMLLDEEYSPKMEGLTVNQLINKAMLPKKLIKAWEPHKFFLQRLQYTHDHIAVEMWEGCFEFLAREYGLTYLPPKKEETPNV